MPSRLPIVSKTFFLLFFALTASSYALYILNSAVSLLVYDLGGEAAFSGRLSTYFTLFACLSRITCGHLTDHISRRSVIIGGGMVLMFSTGMYAFAATPQALVIFRCVQGLGYAAMNVGAITAMMDVIPPSRLGEGIGLYTLAYTLSSSLAPSISLALAERFGYPVLFLSTALVVAASAITIFLFCRYELTAGYQKERKKTALQRKADRRQLLERCGGSRLKALGSSLLEPHAIIPGMVQLTYQFGFSSVFIFMTLYAVTEGIPNPGLFFVTSALFAVIARVTAGRFADKGVAFPCLAVGLLISIASFLLVSYHPVPTIYYLCGALYGFGSGLIAPIMNREALSLVSPARRGAANGTYSISSDIGVGLGSTVWGAVISIADCRTSFRFVALWLCFSLLLTALYFAVSTKRSVGLHL